MRLNIALLTLVIVAVAFAQDPTSTKQHDYAGVKLDVEFDVMGRSAGRIKCELNMDEMKCAAEEVFANCQAASLEWTTCVCPPSTKCKLEDNGGSCDYSCEPVGIEIEDNNAGMGPGNGMA